MSMQPALEWFYQCSQSVIAGVTLATLDPVSDCACEGIFDWFSRHNASIEVFREYYRQSMSRGLQTMIVALRGPAWYSSRLNKEFARDFEREVFVPFAAKQNLDKEEFRAHVLQLCEKMKRENFLQMLFSHDILGEEALQRALEKGNSTLSSPCLKAMAEMLTVDRDDPGFCFLFAQGHLAQAVELNFRESFLCDDRFRNALVYSDRGRRNARLADLEKQIAGLREEIREATGRDDFDKVIELSTGCREFSENVRCLRELAEKLGDVLEAREARIEQLKEQLGGELLDALDDLHSMVSEDHERILRKIADEHCETRDKVDEARCEILDSIKGLRRELVERQESAVETSGEKFYRRMRRGRTIVGKAPESAFAKTSEAAQKRKSEVEFSPLCELENGKFVDMEGRSLPAHLPWPEKVKNEKDGMELLIVPPGPFVMGNDNASSDEAPRHELDLPHLFYMARFPVTNAQYRVYLEEKGGKKACQYEKLAANLPAVDISWPQALEYCRWVGGVLPLEAEWEKAARGGDGRRYPWGEENPRGKAHFSAGGPAPVIAFSHVKSPFGCVDMVGNVWEWCFDWYDSEYYQRGISRDLFGPGKGKFKVVRGACWSDSPLELRVSKRFCERLKSSQPNIGFRYCVRFDRE